MNAISNQGQVIAQYRKSRNWSQEELAKTLNVDTRTVQRMEKQEMIKSLSRRELLVAVLGIPPVLLGLDASKKLVEQTLEIFKADGSKHKLYFFQEELATRWEMYHTGGTTRAGRGLEIWLQEVTRVARTCHGSPWNRDALDLLSMSYQLYSCVQRDSMNFDAAHIAYKRAIRLAKELEDPELIAAAMAREGLTYLQEDRPTDAITYLTGALNVINHQGYFLLRGYTLQALSEAYAKVGKSQDSWHAIGLAEKSWNRRDGSEEHSQARLNISSITAQKGINAVTLRDHERAIALIDKGLLGYDPSFIRGRARLTAQKAEAYYGLGIVDACIITAEEALNLARSVGSSKTIARLQSLHETLAASPRRKEPGVARLGALLTL